MTSKLYGVGVLRTPFSPSVGVFVPGPALGTFHGSFFWAPLFGRLTLALRAMRRLWRVSSTPKLQWSGFLGLAAS